jgi:hypothetical protein
MLISNPMMLEGRLRGTGSADTPKLAVKAEKPAA